MPRAGSHLGISRGLDKIGSRAGCGPGAGRVRPAGRVLHVAGLKPPAKIL